jgi:hypothetical protein
VPFLIVIESRESKAFRGCSADRREPLNADPLGGIRRDFKMPGPE